jgi:hypothetical protein
MSHDFSNFMSLAIIEHGPAGVSMLRIFLLLSMLAVFFFFLLLHATYRKVLKELYFAISIVLSLAFSCSLFFSSCHRHFLFFLVEHI